MAGMGSEVSHKIRAAIKAKLIELNAYVDDELPDYIMVMVANKRSRSQMEGDLTLFLNNNTKPFTAWLHTVLKKLQEITVTSSAKKSETTPETKKKEASLKSGSGKEKERRKKYSKKTKERKKKKAKHKSKEEKKKKTPEQQNQQQKAASELSDWEEEVVVPKKKSKEDRDGVSKAIGRAIIGNLKEKHKERETSKDATNSGIKIPENKAEDDFDIEEAPALKERAPTVMVPTKALLKEHDKITQAEEQIKVIETPDPEIIETENATNGNKEVKKGPGSKASSSSSSAAELRRELLLSRAKKKLEERNLETRMRSNSPEIVVVEEKVVTKPENKPKEVVPVSEKVDNSSIGLSLSHSSMGSERSLRKKSPVPLKSTVVSKRKMPSSPPEEPEISSVVHVKPREFVPPEKQANKNLILKAVAAANKSIASVPAREEKPEKKEKESGRPRAIYTKDLRTKKYENFEVNIDNDSMPINRDGEERDNGRRKSGEDGTFISSKVSGKNKSSTFIECWLEKVEEAGDQEELVKPEDDDKADISESPKPAERVISPVMKEAPSSNEDDDEDDDAVEEEKSPQIVVTVGGLSTTRNAKNRKIKALVDVNRISDRFAKITHPEENHEFKVKYREFVKTRKEKKTPGGLSRNKRLIAELSQKFGRVDRVFDDEHEEPNWAAKDGRWNKGVVSDRFAQRSGLRINRGEEEKTSLVSERFQPRSGVRINRGEEKSRRTSLSNPRSIPEEEVRRMPASEVRSSRGNVEDSGRQKRGRNGSEERSRSRRDGSEERSRSRRDDDGREHKRRRNSDRDDDRGKRRSEEVDAKEGKKRKEDRSSKKDKIRVSADLDESIDSPKGERCRFWPECARGSSCEYHHPTSICRLLPNCRFREKCLYIHPLCKMDKNCDDVECAYDHTRKLMPGSFKDVSRIPCKFDSNCRNSKCGYAHSRKSCKFGSSCKQRDCRFSHSIDS